MPAATAPGRRPGPAPSRYTGAPARAATAAVADRPPTEPPTSCRPQRGLAALVFLIAFAAFLLGLAPSPYWLDSSELVAAAFELGIAHPPGHPAALLVDRLLLLLPIGGAAFRVGLASALAAATAAAAASLLATRLLRLGEGEAGPLSEPLRLTFGAVAGLGTAGSFAVAFQAVRPEVYALHLALLLAALLGLTTDGRDRRWRLLAALAAGLALANHHLLTLPLLAGGGLYLLLGRELDRRLLAGLALTVAVGLLLYAYLPLRASRLPEVDWGAPSTVERFLWTVTGRAFQKSLAHAEAGAAEGVAIAVGVELGLLFPFAVLGAYLLLRLPSTRRRAGLLLVVLLLDAAAPASVGFDEANPDALGYLAPAVALGTVFAALGLGLVAARLGRPRWSWLLAVAALAATVAQGLVAWPRWERRRFADVARVSRALLAEAPPRALLVSSNFQTVFQLWYARGVEGARPDVDHLHRHFLAYPGYRPQLLARRPHLAAVLGDHDAVGLPVAARRRPVLAEFDLDLPAALTPHLRPRGLWQQVDPLPVAVPPAEESAAVRRLDELRTALDGREPQTARALFYFDFLDGVRACAAGRREFGAQAITRAQARLGGRQDPDLEALAERCRR